MPLAMGYLKAMVLDDEELRKAVRPLLISFRGGDSAAQMAENLFAEGCPDMVAFSVCGWNLFQFGAVSETFRQLNPEGWIIWGGTHVANQAARVFRLFPWVDVVANGEGEYVFRQLLRARLGGQSVRDLKEVAGISYQDDGQRCVTTATGSRIDNLDSIPSPFLTEALPLYDAQGRFRYDVALMETSRGCPYKCAFCYWGGAIGQKIRAFSRERLRAELEVFARARVETLVLCDSNFGLRVEDEQFIDDVIEMKSKHGYPRTLETSWAKNKSKTFFRIVEKMKRAGLHSSFTLALQTLSGEALTDMHRRNMKVNDWESLVAWLQEQGMDCYAELIWGAPGDTPESFLAGYDSLAALVPRIATYPLLLLPNTDYLARRAEYGFVTVRGQTDDFEYVLAHRTMTMKENQKVQRFLLWARIATENPTLRLIWPALLKFAGVSQSVALLSLAGWFDSCEHPAADGLRSSEVKFGDPMAVPRALRALCSRRDVDKLLEDWWRQEMAPQVPVFARVFLGEIFRYDVATRPIFAPTCEAVVPGHCQLEDKEELIYVSEAMAFRFLPDDLTGDHRASPPTVPAPRGCRVTFRHRAGYADYLANHEMATRFLGVPRVVTGRTQGRLTDRPSRVDADSVTPAGSVRLGT
jgi:hypothetical protein